MPVEKETREELTNLLMEYVRNLVKKGATNEAEVAVLPSVAMVLEKLTQDRVPFQPTYGDSCRKVVN